MKTLLMQECPSCINEMVGIAGRKDAICNNCGYKEPCC